MGLLLCPALAFAHPPPLPDDPVEWQDDPALVEWSTWFRLGWGESSTPSDTAARTTMPIAPHTLQSTWQTGLGADASLTVTSHARLGTWLELQDLTPTAGIELVLTALPRELDMFQYDGEGVLIARAGGGRDRATAALAWGYRCPWKLWGPYDAHTRYEIGVRFVLTATRSYDDPHDWSATIGLETELFGALRYLASIRSWY